MSRVKSMGLRNYIGKLGGAVYYMNKGQNIGRELAPEISNPRTYAQMQQRMRWANLVNTYKANKSWMGRLSFESKPQTWSDYNAFMSANLNYQPCYLTKEEAEQGAIWLAPYTMTKGSLPSISYSFVNTAQATGISTGIVVKNNFDTVGALATEILANNTEWQAGDQLSIIFEFDVWSQNTDIRVVPIEIILDPTDTTELDTLPFIEDLTLSDILTKGDNDTLYVELADLTIKYKGVSAGCLIHSRSIAGKTYVSTQAYVLSEGAYDNYVLTGTEEALQEAIASYGESTQYFLDTAQRAPRTVNPIASIIGTYQPTDSVVIQSFVIVRGGTNTFKSGAENTRTSLTLTTNTALNEDDYIMAFFDADGQKVAETEAAERTTPNVITFSFEYADAVEIVDKAGSFRLYNSSTVTGDPVDTFPVV